MFKVSKTELPNSSVSKQFIGEVNYVDAYKVELSDSNQTIEQIYLAIFNHTPKWVNFLMSLRNKIVGLFGLDTGNGETLKEVKSIAVGDTQGMFKIFEIQPNEVIVGADDKHLDFRASVLKENKMLFMSTLVHYNSTFGKLYFFIVKPFHKVIVKAMLKNAIKNKRI